MAGIAFGKPAVSGPRFHKRDEATPEGGRDRFVFPRCLACKSFAVVTAPHYTTRSLCLTSCSAAAACSRPLQHIVRRHSEFSCSSLEDLFVVFCEAIGNETTALLISGGASGSETARMRESSRRNAR